ncbi:hypothetical protein LIER_04334 [Lithospermum erythrorhizon]|uniref:Uncharacterized protein n=1 Tax=Lithospermum erythrorhizon TaxID=34254 RepID=A0AAV3NZ56_LITER
MGPVSASMLDGVTLEASNSNSLELGWKSVTKGKRSKKHVGRNVNEIIKVGGRSPKKFDGSVTRKLVSNGSDHIPPKKRRGPLLDLTPLRTPGPQSSPHEDFKLQSKELCKPSVTKPKVDSAGFPDEDFAGIALLAAAACIEGIDDASHFNVIEQHPTPEKASVSASREPIKCSISIEKQNSPIDMVKESTDSQCSSLANGASLSQSVQVNEDVVVNDLEAAKVDRFHWDLNIEMDAWEKPLEDSAGETPSVDVSYHSLEVEKLQGDGCRVSVKSDYDVTENSRPLCQVELINSEPANNTDRARNVSVLDVCPAKLTNDLAGQKLSSNLGSPSVQSHQVSCAYFDEGPPSTASGNTSIVCETAKVINEDIPSRKDKNCMENIDLTILERFPHESDINDVTTASADEASYLPDSFGNNSPTPEGHTISIAVPDSTVIEAAPLPFPSMKDDGSPSCNLSSCSAKVDSNLGNCPRFDVSQGHVSNTVDSKDMTRLQDGNDSPYEDGELRLSIPCSWEENELDYGDNDCVDYESDCVDYPGSEVVEAGSDGSLGVEKQNLPVRETSISELGPSGSLKNYMIGGAGVGGIMVQSCDRMGYYMRDNNLGRRHSSYHLGGIETKGSHQEEMYSRKNRVKSQSLDEGSGYMDVMEKTNTGYLQQNNRSRIYSRPIRDVNPDKFMGRQRSSFHVRERNGEGDQWGSRSHMNHGPAGPKYYKPRNMTADFEKISGLNSEDNRQSMYYSSKASYQADNRRLPYEMDDHFRVQRRTPENTDRSRTDSGNYRQGVSRGNRNECYDPSHEKRTFPSSHMPRYFSKRELSHSPPSGRVSQSAIARRRSRSRSRSRSPYGGRRYTRPNFRSEARVDREKLPFQKPSFHSEHPGNARDGYSAQRNSRWVDNHNFVENLRNRKSSVSTSERIFRYNSISSDGRYKEDNYYRPGNRHGRFPPVAGAGRGCNFGKKYDDRRDERVDGMHRTRHSDTNDVAVGRYKHDPEDNFDGNISRKEDVRNTEHRYVARSSNEDRRSFKV